MNRKIYLLLTKTGTRFSGMISKATGYEYSHASLSLDKKLTNLYSFGRKNMLFPFIAGFVKEDIDSGVFEKYKDTKCILYEIEVTLDVYNSIEKIINRFLKEKHNYKYNFLGIPFIFFDIPYRREKHFLCSQFVAYVLHKSGAVKLDREFTIMKPSDFMSIVNKKLIYNGFLRQYRYS